MNSSANPNAMPLREFIDETVKVLGTDAQEIHPQLMFPPRTINNF
jgi:hypothetical protein